MKLSDFMMKVKAFVIGMFFLKNLVHLWLLLNPSHYLSISHFYSLQCSFIDVSLEDELYSADKFNFKLIKKSIRLLLQCINERVGHANVYQSVVDGIEPDIR